MPPLRLEKLLVLPPLLRSLAVRQFLQPTFTAPLPRRHQSTTSSVNESEVSHFNALASTWWDPHGSSRLLHLMNPLRHKFIQRCLASNEENHAQTKKRHYLDIGCGGGIFAESAARRRDAASVTAIDPTPDVIAVAKQHARRDPLLLEPGRLTYLNTAIETLEPRAPDGPRAGYDVITLFEVLEHIQHPTPFLGTCLSHLKPGGWLIGSTIARTTASWVTTKLMAEDVLRIVPRGTHEWSQYIQPNELREWARVQKGLEFDGKGAGWEIMGVVYVPGFGWKEVEGSEGWGNYFFGVRKKAGDV